MAPKVKYTKKEFALAGLEVIRKKGYMNLTAQAVAEELHCSTRPIFTCFGVMDELKKIIHETAEELWQQYEQKGLNEDIPFFAVGVQYVKFAKEEPEIYKMLFLTNDGYCSAMNTMLKLQDLLRDSLMNIYHIDGKTADFYFRQLWLVASSLATLVVTQNCPYSEKEIGQILTSFSISTFKAIKEIPNFVEGTFDRDKIFNSLIGK